jgi:hypothetical protein
MAKIVVSKKLTAVDCQRKATEAARRWEQGLTERGSRGEFRIGHGGDLPCDVAHLMPVNRGLFIGTTPKGCLVFVRKRSGQLSDWAGASRVDLSRYRGTRFCICGDGH